MAAKKSPTRKPAPKPAAAKKPTPRMPVMPPMGGPGIGAPPDLGLPMPGPGKRPKLA